MFRPTFYADYSVTVRILPQADRRAQGRLLQARRLGLRGDIPGFSLASILVRRGFLDDLWVTFTRTVLVAFPASFAATAMGFMK